MTYYNIDGTSRDTFQIGKNGLYLTRNIHIDAESGSLTSHNGDLYIKKSQWSKVKGASYSEEPFCHYGSFPVTEPDLIDSLKHQWGMYGDYFVSTSKNKKFDCFLDRTQPKYFHDLSFENLTEFITWINDQYAVEPFNGFNLLPKTFVSNEFYLNKTYGVNKFYSWLKGRKKYLERNKTIDPDLSWAFLDSFKNSVSNFYFSNNNMISNECFWFGNSYHTLYGLPKNNTEFRNITLKKCTNGIDNIDIQDGSTWQIESRFLAFSDSLGNISCANNTSHIWNHRQSQFYNNQYTAIVIYVLYSGSSPGYKAFYIKPLGVDQLYTDYIASPYTLEVVHFDRRNRKLFTHEVMPERSDLEGNRSHFPIGYLWPHNNKYRKFFTNKNTTIVLKLRLKNLETLEVSEFCRNNIVYKSFGYMNPGHFLVE